MSINLQTPDITEMKPRITVFGVGGGGCNAVNNMIETGLQGVDFVVANTDAQALTMSKAERLIQMGVAVTEGLGAGSQPEIGRAAAEEAIDEINDQMAGAHMVFITAGMGGGTGTGAAPIVARAAREAGILTVGVVTKPFQFEGQRRMRIATEGIEELQQYVDTLIVIPNQNLFRIANEKTTFADAFAMADEVLYSGVACITDLMVKDGLINLDFADVRSVMREMGKAMMGTGEASGEKRAVEAAEKAISNPLLDDVRMQGAQGLLISITGGRDMTLFEVDEAASRVREEVDNDANIIFGATFDESLEGTIRVSVVATGIDHMVSEEVSPAEERMAELTRRLKSVSQPQPAAQAASADLARKPAPGVETLEEELGIPQMRASVNQPQMRRAAADPSVKIGPFRPDPSLIKGREPEDDLDLAGQVVPETGPSEPFIPEAAETPTAVRARMPRVEDFPAIAQKQLRGAAPETRTEAKEARTEAKEDRRPRGLLARLTHGLAKREDEAELAADKAGPNESPADQKNPKPNPQPASEFAKQPQPRRMGEPAGAVGGLDRQGRLPAAEAVHDEEELEIPAFLRRQSN